MLILKQDPKDYKTPIAQTKKTIRTPLTDHLEGRNRNEKKKKLTMGTENNDEGEVTYSFTVAYPLKRVQKAIVQTDQWMKVLFLPDCQSSVKRIKHKEGRVGATYQGEYYGPFNQKFANEYMERYRIVECCETHIKILYQPDPKESGFMYFPGKPKKVPPSIQINYKSKSKHHPNETIVEIRDYTIPTFRWGPVECIFATLTCCAIYNAIKSKQSIRQEHRPVYHRQFQKCINDTCSKQNGTK